MITHKEPGRGVVDEEQNKNKQSEQESAGIINNQELALFFNLESPTRSIATRERSTLRCYLYPIPFLRLFITFSVTWSKTPERHTIIKD